MVVSDVQCSFKNSIRGKKITYNRGQTGVSAWNIPGKLHICPIFSDLSNLFALKEGGN